MSDWQPIVSPHGPYVVRGMYTVGDFYMYMYILTALVLVSPLLLHVRRASAALGPVHFRAVSAFPSERI